jgi:hypothetical protein
MNGIMHLPFSAMMDLGLDVAIMLLSKPMVALEAVPSR